VTTAELVLEYVKTLTWPAVVIAATVTFRSPIAKKIGGLKSLDAAGVKTTFESEAEALESKADEIATQVETATYASAARRDAKQAETAQPRQMAENYPPLESETAKAVQIALARRAIENLDEARNFDTARRLATVDPNAAVMAAYRQLEQGTRSASGLLGYQIDVRAQGSTLLIDALGLDAELREVVRELRRLRNAVTHAVEDVTIAGALAYVAATERVMQVVVGKVLSRLRHPSRAKQTEEMLGVADGE
jgi:hypothetical protein